MTTLVLLLRGINLGARRRVSMADLRATLHASGYAGTRTLLQSGNVVLDADVAPERVAVDVAARMVERFGLEVDVVVRTAAELAAVLAEDPLVAVATDPSRHVVTFLPSAPSSAAVAAIGALELHPELVAVHGREVYTWCPGGLHASPAMRALDRIDLGATATTRNRRTLERLAALAAPD